MSLGLNGAFCPTFLPLFHGSWSPKLARPDLRFTVGFGASGPTHSMSSAVRSYLPVREAWSALDLGSRCWRVRRRDACRKHLLHPCAKVLNGERSRLLR